MTRNSGKQLSQKDAAIVYHYFGEAIKHEVARYSVGIVTIDDGGKPHENGSGTCIKTGSRYFILTAAHVVLGCSPDKLWIVTKGGSMNKRAVPLRVGVRGGYRDQAVDVAYIEVDERTVHELEIEALPLNRLHGRPILTGEVIAISGIPRQRLEIRRRGHNPDDIDLIWTPFIAITLQTDAAKWHADTDPSVVLETDYPEEFASALPGGATQELPDAPGLSGGGYWLCNLPKVGDVWSAAHIELAGTITHWDKARRYLLANRVANTIGLLSDDYPEWRALAPR